MFLLVPAYPGCPGSKAVKRSLLLLLLLLLRLVGVECVKSPTNQPCLPTDVSSNSCVLMSNDEGADLLPDDTDDGHS